MIRNVWIVSLIVFMSIAGCQREQAAQVPETIVNTGQQTSELLMKTLKHELVQAISNEGVAGGIRICSELAIELTDSIARESQDVLAVKRTTFEYRNPVNAPDSIDRKVLEYYQKTMAADQETPPYFIERTESNDQIRYIYYQPLKVQGLCLNCHGSENEMSEDVLSIIKQKYPQDRATGYSIGDFRGLIRVDLQSPAN